MLADSGLPIISADTMAEAATKIVAVGEALKNEQHEHPDQQDAPVITQGITGGQGSSTTRMTRRLRQRQGCFVAGVNPKKAGEPSRHSRSTPASGRGQAQTGPRSA